MPLYEYYCSDCHTRFEILRPMSQADTPVACENCESEHTARVLSVFAAFSGDRSIAGGGCACGGSCGCGHSHN